MPAHFRIGRNPDPASRLPFLLGLPVAGEGEVVLACAVDWPGAKDAFCFQLGAWPDGAAVLEEVPIEGCWRAGKSLHLVLRRRSRRRSLFVWTAKQGRTLIFWRTQKTMTAARPGLKVMPARGLDAPLTIAVDQRERYAWKFPQQRAHLVRRTLPVGDYGVFDGDRLVAAIERKSPANLAGDAVGGQLGFLLADLERLPHGCLVVEGRLSEVLKAPGDHVKPGWLMSVLAALQVAHPRVPWVFAETRALAEDYGYRWLAAALKRHREGPAATSMAAGGPGPDEAVQLTLAEDREPYAVHDRVGRQAEALRLAEAGQAWTSGAYARHFGVSQATAWQDLTDLVATGDLVAEGNRRTRQYRRPVQS
jgi:hypothetical protein